MVENISRELRQRGHDVHVHASAGLSTQSTPCSSRGGPGRLARFKRKWKRNLWFLRAMARNPLQIARDRTALQRFDPDVVLARQDAYSWSVAKAAIDLNIPLVTYADAPVAYETRTFNPEQRFHPPRLVEWLEQWVLRNSQAIITVSHPARQRLEGYGLSTPIHVIHNGVDEFRFPRFRETDRQAIRRTLGITTPIVVGFVGSFRAFHGIDRLREMIARTSSDQVSWLLVGDGPERLRLEDALQGNVNALFLGQRPHEEMGGLLSVMDIAVAPHARMNGDFYFCPLKILEYAASGCATVASHQGDIPLLLADGQGGLTLESDDPDAWVAAIQQLTNDLESARKMGTTARDFVLHHLTWRHTSTRVETVLQEAAGLTDYHVEDIPLRNPLATSHGAATPPADNPAGTTRETCVAEGVSDGL